jgi:acetyl-CoA carboxylase carboxyl transferase subunit alpha
MTKMSEKFTPLEFEKPIYQIEDKIEELKQLSADTGINLDDQVNILTEQALEYKKQLY